ncbi:ester cyclase [Streptomyces phaeochromogenes]|uniref:ester cyclase n=1 Tax=Streptomyces phaeochromogenes TaxID=1923 RepID=UPI0036ACE5FB
MTTTIDRNVALIRRAYQCVESGDLDTAQEPLTANFIPNVAGVAEPLHGKEFKARGRSVSYRSVEVYRFEGDRIAEEWVAPDLLSLMQQIAPTSTNH